MLLSVILSIVPAAPDYILKKKYLLFLFALPLQEKSLNN